MKKDFKKGDIIEFSGDLFKVLENHGESGTVQEYPDGEVVSPFYWEFEGEECVLLESNEKILLPKELTAENGAKALLIGEFHESYEVANPEYCGDDCFRIGCDRCENCDTEDELREEFINQQIPVSWTTIKEIYKKIVEHYQEK